MKYVAKTLKISREEGADDKGMGGKVVKYEVPTEVKQFESLAEVIQDAGSEESVVKFVNGAVIADSAVSPRVFAGTKGAIALSVDDLFKKVQELRKAFSLSGAGRGVSKADKISFADAAVAIDNDNTLSDEEKAVKMLALVRAAKA